MTRDPFLRFALIVLGSLYVVGLAVFERLYGPWWCGSSIAGSIAAAAVLSLEFEPRDEGEPRWRRFRQPREGTKGFERIQP